MAEQISFQGIPLQSQTVPGKSRNRAYKKAWDTSLRSNEKHGKYKVIVDKIVCSHVNSKLLVLSALKKYIKV